MKILLIGGSGQLGQSLQRAVWPDDCQLIAPSRDELDITSSTNLELYFKIQKPDVVINSAAWTDVVGAEGNSDQCFAVNADGVEKLVRFAKENSSTFIHISTDYVFDGTKNVPYSEEDSPKPLNTYGKSKLAGESIIQDSGLQYYILRTSWLYSKFGRNFVKSIARKALLNESATITDDQFGSPTSANDLATGIVSIVSQKPPYGTYHFSNHGSTSWYEFGRKIYELLGKDPSQVTPRSSELDSVARPMRSSFNLSKWADSDLAGLISWEESLRINLPEIVAELEKEMSA